jgi:hypothetical protein
MHADLMLGAAHGNVLDQQVLQLLNGGGSKRKLDTRWSMRKRFLMFANANGALPLMPTKSTVFFRYALHLAHTGVHSGWDGVGKYITEVVRWNHEFGYPDFRLSCQWWWDRFRDEFKQCVQVAHRGMKLPIRPAHLQAMAAGADLNDPTDLRDIASYFLLYFCGVRIGHVAGSASGPSHCIRYEDLHWEPSFEAPERVYLCFRSTKTRPRAADTPYWSAINRQAGMRWCPLLLLQQHIKRTYKGVPGDCIFQSVRGGPLPRSTFTSSLRRRLTAAAPLLDTPVDLSKFSGTSFRKGFLTTLGPMVPSHRLADAADHSSVESSRIYTVDSLKMRAANSDLVATAFVARM